MFGLWGTRSPAAGPDLRLIGTDTPDPVTVGELLNYNLVVTNVGTGTATGVILTNTLSTNATFFSASASQGTNTAGGGLVVCNLGSINAGSAATIQNRHHTRGGRHNHQFRIRVAGAGGCQCG